MAGKPEVCREDTPRSSGGSEDAPSMGGKNFLARQKNPLGKKKALSQKKLGGGGGSLQGRKNLHHLLPNF